MRLSGDQARVEIPARWPERTRRSLPVGRDQTLMVASAAAEMKISVFRCTLIMAEGGTELRGGETNSSLLSYRLLGRCGQQQRLSDGREEPFSACRGRSVLPLGKEVVELREKPGLE